MNFNHLRRWLRASFPATPDSLIGAVRILDASVDSRSRSNAYEIAMNSSDGMRAMGIAHLHFHGGELAPERAAAAGGRKLDGTARVIAGINAVGGARFSMAAFESLRARALADEAVAFHPLLSAEWRLDRRSPLKLTLYFRAPTLETLRAVWSILGVPMRAATARTALRNQECLGVDFFPGGGTALKIYSATPFAGSPAGGICESAVAEIAARFPVKDVGFLARVRDDGRLDGERKLGLRLWEGASADELIGLASFKPYRAFLRRLGRRLGSNRIYYICLNGRRLELLFRATRPVWSRVAQGRAR